MTMVNVVGSMDILEDVAEYVVLSNSLHPVNAIDEIGRSDFNLSVTENNLDALIDFNHVRPYVNKTDYSQIKMKIKKLDEIIEKDDEKVRDDELILDSSKLEEKLDFIIKKFEKANKDLSFYRTKKEKLEEYKENISYIKDIDLTIEDLKNLKNFYIRVFRLPKSNYLKIKSNYENIPAIIISDYKDREFQVAVVFAPKIMEGEIEKLFKSLNAKKLILPIDYTGTPKDISEGIDNELINVNADIKDSEKALEDIYTQYKRDIAIIRRSFQLKQKSLHLKEYVAHTREFFYLCGWVAESMMDRFKEKMSYFDSKIVIIERSPDRVHDDIEPPTKLKNNPAVKPFESMVYMYGVPSYTETDPTCFFAISYMIMFGLMFGDVGQGLVFLLAGLYLKYKKNNYNFGGILARLGISSTIFGFLYGSVFGFEDVIDPLLIRPMENIKEMLIFAIILGCGFLIIGFIYSLINNAKKGDLENGLFGKNGLVGLVFYISLLVFAYTKINNVKSLNTNTWVILFVVLLALMVFKQPIANIILKKRPLYNEDKSDYYIEGGFGVIETLLSMFSNTISFIRVGAFALNHVGLFIAFASMAQMINNGFGSAFMYVLGNIIIIGLEGLIVFIQGLRLEYYELFSKYYEGSGFEFNPIGFEK